MVLSLDMEVGETKVASNYLIYLMFLLAIEFSLVVLLSLLVSHSLLLAKFLGIESRNNFGQCAQKLILPVL